MNTKQIFINGLIFFFSFAFLVAIGSYTKIPFLYDITIPLTMLCFVSYVVMIFASAALWPGRAALGAMLMTGVCYVALNFI